MIAKKTISKNYNYLDEFFVNVLRNSHINWIIFDICLIIQSIQLLSYVYNCIYKHDHTDDMKNFSEITTYFRVYIFNI